jgi:Protein of unknown function (DUF3604)
MQRNRTRLSWLGIGVLTVALLVCGGWVTWAQESPQREVFFGETHVHTSWSFDAYIFGNHITSPADAYKSLSKN